MSSRTRPDAKASWTIAAVTVGAVVASAVVTALAAVVHPTPMATIPAGEYLPFFQASPGKGKTRAAPAPIWMPSFRLDAVPVTNGQFLDFVREHPEWRKSRVKAVFADHRYLESWRSDLKLPDERAAAEPVTNVSWFAAEAYCEAKGLRLPTTEQWEYAFADKGRKQNEVEQQSLDWFSTPNPKRLRAAGRGEPNGYGVYDMVGLVWEWTLDFNSFMTGTEQRNTSSKDDAAFCGNALRSSLKANYTVENVGFRCEADQ